MKEIQGNADITKIQILLRISAKRFNHGFKLA